LSKLLIDEYPLVVLPSLAKAIGLSEAIFIQQLHYWLEKSGHERDSRRWVYNTYADWATQFPWWNPGSIRRIIGRLRKLGIVLVTDAYNSSPIDKTLWYTIDHEALGTVTDESDEAPGSVSEPFEEPIDPPEEPVNPPVETPTVENDSPCVPKVQTSCTQGTEDVYREYRPSVPKARSNNQRLPTETIPETTPKREEKAAEDKQRTSADRCSPLPLDDLQSALCSVLKKDYALLPQRKKSALDDAARLLHGQGITAEQVQDFPSFWQDVQPLGPVICATTPHLNQVLEFMTACLEWRQAQRQRAEEAELALQEVRDRRLAYERSHPDLSAFPTGDIPEEVQGWWDQLLSEMQTSLQPAVFDRWLEQARLIDTGEGILTILVPDELRQQWLELRFNDQLHQRLLRIADQDLRLRYVLQEHLEEDP